MKLVSACLLGIKCAWSGDQRYKNQAALRLLEVTSLLPICPEQQGGLTTPRAAQEIQGGSGENVLDGRCRIINRDGEDVTLAFIRGAEAVLSLAKQLEIKEFIGKAHSPSCGCGLIYDGSFLHQLVPGDGVTTALLKRNDIRVITEEEL